MSLQLDPPTEPPNEQYPPRGQRWIDRFTKKMDQTIPLGMEVLRYGMEAKRFFETLRK